MLWDAEVYLFVDEALVLPAVLVHQVQRVSAELHAAGLFALDEEGILRTWVWSAHVSSYGCRADVRTTSQIRSLDKLS